MNAISVCCCANVSPDGESYIILFEGIRKKGSEGLVTLWRTYSPWDPIPAQGISGELPEHPQVIVIMSPYRSSCPSRSFGSRVCFCLTVKMATTATTTKETAIKTTHMKVRSGSSRWIVKVTLSETLLPEES